MLAPEILLKVETPVELTEGPVGETLTIAQLERRTSENTQQSERKQTQNKENTNGKKSRKDERYRALNEVECLPLRGTYDDVDCGEEEHFERSFNQRSDQDAPLQAMTTRDTLFSLGSAGLTVLA